MVEWRRDRQASRVNALVGLDMAGGYTGILGGAQTGSAAGGVYGGALATPAGALVGGLFAGIGMEYALGNPELTEFEKKE